MLQRMRKEVNGSVFESGGKVALRRENFCLREIFRKKLFPRPSGWRVIPRKGWNTFLFRSRSRVVPKRPTSGSFSSWWTRLRESFKRSLRQLSTPTFLDVATTTARDHPRPFGPLSVISTVLFKDLKISGGRVYPCFKDPILLFL